MMNAERMRLIETRRRYNLGEEILVDVIDQPYEERCEVQIKGEHFCTIYKKEHVPALAHLLMHLVEHWDIQTTAIGERTMAPEDLCMLTED